MATDEAGRHQLYTRLQETLGPDEATTLMDYLPPVGWADVATKGDLEHLQASMTHEIDQLRAATHYELEIFRLNTTVRFDSLNTDVARLKEDVGTLKTDVAELKEDVGTLKTDVAGLKTEFGGLRGEFGDLRGEFGKLKGDLEHTLNRNMVSLILIMIGLVGALGAVIKL